MSIRPCLVALVLLAAFPAEAGQKAPRATAWMVNNFEVHPVFGLLVASDPANEVARVDVALRSEAGSEEVTLVESDAWLHGAATLPSLPKTTASLTLTLYDAGSAASIAFEGTLGADGVVTLAADKAGADCTSRSGCESGTAGVDIEVLAAEVFPAADGYAVAFDLAGADTYGVAYAKITVVEGGAVTTCDKVSGLCTTTGAATTVAAEVDWDAIGAVWTGALALDHTGAVEAEAVTYDARGKKVESPRYSLGAPWLDEGGGVPTLALGDDRHTTVGLTRWDGPYDGGKTPSTWSGSRTVLTVGSVTWSAGDLPTHARLDLDGGDTITIPVHSYQRKLDVVGYGFDHRVLTAGRRLAVQGNGVAFPALSAADLASPVCSDGTCIVLVEDDAGALGVSVTTYGPDADALPDTMDLALIVTDALGEKVWSQAIAVDFEPEITALFATELVLAQDPLGLGLSGKLSLLGAADTKGKQATLTKASFQAAFGRDGDGDLGLVAVDANHGATSANVAAGAALSLTGDDGLSTAPPAVVYSVMGNGSGTKNASSQTSIRPQLL